MRGIRFIRSTLLKALAVVLFCFLSRWHTGVHWCFILYLCSIWCVYENCSSFLWNHYSSREGNTLESLLFVNTSVILLQMVRVLNLEKHCMRISRYRFRRLALFLAGGWRGHSYQTKAADSGQVPILCHEGSQLQGREHWSRSPETRSQTSNLDVLFLLTSVSSSVKWGSGIRLPARSFVALCWALKIFLLSTLMSSQPGPDDKKSELLPAEWNSNKDLYVLRYESKDGSRKLLVKAVTVENSVIINVLVSLRDMLASAGGSGHRGRLCVAHSTVRRGSLKCLWGLYPVTLLLEPRQESSI